MWQYAFNDSLKTSHTVEVPLSHIRQRCFVLPENQSKYEATNDGRYLQNITRLIVESNTEINETRAYYMTIVPSAEYLEKNNFLIPSTITYFDRDSSFNGYIIYFDMEGSPVNGWIYENGKITHKIYPAATSTTRAITYTCIPTYTIEYIEWTYSNNDNIDYTFKDISVEWDCWESSGLNESMQEVPGLDEGGGGGYSPPPIEANDNVKRIATSVNMTKEQVSSLNKAINEFVDKDCMQKTLYDALVGKNVKMDFRLYSNPKEDSAPASYDPRDKSLKFKDNNSITKENLKEELFHAWQDADYLGGTAQYGKDSQGNKLPGYVNIEFEAKVFKDLIMEMGVLSAFFKQETDEEQEIHREYVKWIESIKENTSILMDTQKYNKWVDLFNIHNPDYSSPKSNHFSALNGLHNLINMSNCF